MKHSGMKHSDMKHLEKVLKGGGPDPIFPSVFCYKIPFILKSKHLEIINKIS